jgi:fatty acid desaturase
MSTSSASGEEFRTDLRKASARVLPPELVSELTRLHPWRGYVGVAQTLAILIVTLSIAASVWTPWVVIAAVFIIATQQHALFVLAHDAAHYRLAPQRTVNDLLGRLVGAAAGISMCSYRVIHRLHHNHLYGKEDPDIALHGGYPRGKAYLLRKLTADRTGVTAYKTYKYFFGAPALDIRTNKALRPLDDTSPALREAARRDRRSVVAMQVALLLAVLGAFGPEGLIKYVVLWLVPAVTVLQAILRVRAIAEHGAPADYASPLTAARTNLGNALTRFVLFPHHVNYHIEHHLYPAVPHYNLPHLHAALARHGLFEGAEVRSFRQTWRRVFADPVARPAA